MEGGRGGGAAGSEPILSAGAGGTNGGAPDRGGASGAAGRASAGTGSDAGGAGGASVASPLSWSTAIGQWCADPEGRSLWLAAAPDWTACADRAVRLNSNDVSDGLRARVALPATGLVGEEQVGDATLCLDGVCRSATIRVRLGDYQEGFGAAGSWVLDLADGTEQRGEFDATWCSWDDHIAGSVPVRALRLQEIAAFQTVRITLARSGNEVVDRTADLVAEREALIRAYASPSVDWVPRNVRGRLTLKPSDSVPPQIFEDVLVVSGYANDRFLDSTFNFTIPASLLTPSAAYSVELLEVDACAEHPGEAQMHRFPEAGEVALRARKTGGIRVEVIPLRVGAGEAALLPETSSASMDRLRSALLKLFPISGAEITIREDPVEALGSTIDEHLDQITALRNEEAPDVRLTYYGLFRPATTYDEYCVGSDGCVLGSAVIGDLANPLGGVAVGVGFGIEADVTTFVHELGHVYGREHAPCGTSQGVDPNYPYGGGAIGGWGYDLTTQTLIDPALHIDFMGYCAPAWASDYGYQLIADYVAAHNGLR